MSQTNAQLLADSLGTASTGTVPIGGIILWSGSTGSVPDGWALCNGSNGTPNLQDRFVVGAGSGYAVDATGGSANAVLIGHSHGTYGSESGYRHVVRAGIDAGFDWDSHTSNPNDAHYDSNSRTDATGQNSSGSSSTTQTGTNANLPPYYALAYIMRTS